MQEPGRARLALGEYDESMRFAAPRSASRRRRDAPIAVALAAAVACFPAAAHHSLGAVYDATQRHRIEGVVAEFQFINPHPFVIVTVAGEGGEETWRLEMDNRFELARIGVTESTLQPGDRVIVSGSLGRNEPRILYIRRLDRPADGFRYEQVGSQPRVSRDGG